MYRAIDSNTGQMVSVKQIKLESFKEEDIVQLMQEVDLLRRLSHPNLIKYKSTARDKNTLSIVLECVPRSPCACSLWLCWGVFCYA